MALLIVILGSRTHALALAITVGWTICRFREYMQLQVCLRASPPTRTRTKLDSAVLTRWTDTACVFVVCVCGVSWLCFCVLAMCAHARVISCMRALNCLVVSCGVWCLELLVCVLFGVSCGVWCLCLVVSCGVWCLELPFVWWCLVVLLWLVASCTAAA
jgi:hypothetical protein